MGRRSRSQCLKMTSLTELLQYYVFSFRVVFEAFGKRKKKSLSTHNCWHPKSVAMAVAGKFKSLHCLQSNREESVEPSLLSAALPEAAGSQDPQVFHAHQTPAAYPHFWSSAPGQRRSCCFSTSADHIRRSSWSVSAVPTKLWFKKTKKTANTLQ